MQTHRETSRKQSSAHRMRTQELARRLSVRISQPATSVLDLCRELDQAAEFAALEGTSIGDSVREFLAEVSGAYASDLGEMMAAVRVAREHQFAPLMVIPSAVSRLLRTDGETVSTVELERIAASDPVLAARLLGAANSARFGSRSRITGLREAILRVGIPEARRTLLSACVAGFFASRGLQDLWKHSQEVATAAWEIAGQAGIDKEAAWIAGLLHDVGRLAFASLPVAARQEEMSWVEAGFPLAYAETLAHGTDHAAIGAALLRQWDLPAEIVEAVALHHRPECSDSRLTAVMCLAEEFVARRSGDAEEDLWSALRQKVACERAGIIADETGKASGLLGTSACA